MQILLAFWKINKYFLQLCRSALKLHIFFKAAQASDWSMGMFSNSKSMNFFFFFYFYFSSNWLLVFDICYNLDSINYFPILRYGMTKCNLTVTTFARNRIHRTIGTGSEVQLTDKLLLLLLIYRVYKNWFVSASSFSLFFVVFILDGCVLGMLSIENKDTPNIIICKIVLSF